MASFGGMIRRVPRLLRDALTEEIPLLEEEMMDFPGVDITARTPPFLPEGSDVSFGGPIDPGQLPTGRTVQTGTSRQPRTFLKDLAGSLPGMLDAGLAAAATPNIGGGGFSDIARGLLNASDRGRVFEQQEIQNQLAQLAGQTGMRRADAEVLLRESQMLNNARQLQESLNKRPKKFMPVGTGVWDLENGEWASEPTTNTVPVRADVARSAGVAVPPGQETVNLDTATAGKVLSTFSRTIPQARAPSPWRIENTDARGNVTATEIDDGIVTTHRLGPLGKPVKTSRSMTPTDKDALERDFSDQVGAVYDEFDDRDYWEFVFGKTVNDSETGEPKPDLRFRKQEMDREVKRVQELQDKFDKASGRQSPRSIRKQVRDRRKKMFEEWGLVPQKDDTPSNPLPKESVTGAGTATDVLNKWLSGEQGQMQRNRSRSGITPGLGQPSF